jgi:hypothetical protein
MIMKLSLQLEPRDLEAYSGFVHGGRAGLVVQRLLPVVLILGVAGFVAVQLNVVREPGNLYLPLLILGFFAFFTWRQRVATRKKGTALFQPMTLTLSDAGLASEAEGRSSTATWASVKGYYRSETHVFIMLDGLAGHIVPMRCLSGEGQVQQFLSELQSHTAELPPPGGKSTVLRAVLVWFILLLVVGFAWNLARVSSSP